MIDAAVSYELRRSARSRSIRIAVDRHGRVRVSAPVRARKEDIERVVHGHRGWIAQAVGKALERRAQLPPDLAAETYAHYLRYKERARLLAHRKVKQWNAHFGFTVKRIAIKRFSSRWGSCSYQGNINLHYKLLFLPDRLLDYVVVHELCHLAHLNHSPAFWAAVARVLPDWRTRRAELQSL